MTRDIADSEAGTSKHELRLRAELQARDTVWPETVLLSVEEGKKILHDLRVHQIELEMQNEELRRAQVTIETLRSRYFDLYDLAPVGYVTLTEAGLILEANLRFSSLVGMPRAELINQPLSRFIVRDDQDIYYLHRKKLFATDERQTFELRMKLPDGAPFWARLEATKADADDGETAYCRLTATDISEQRALQEKLAQTNHMASMGMLAAGVAHEINNPLTAVLHNIGTLATDLPAMGGAVTRVCRALQKQLGDNALTDIAGKDGAELVREPALVDLGNLAAQAATATHRIHEIMKGLTSFSRQERNEVSSMDLNTSAREAITIATNQIKYRAKLIVDLGQLPPILANAGRLSQVFVNLLVNAAQSIANGDRERNWITVRTWSEENQVFGEVSDTGCGIPPSDLGSVFEPFFTTKSPERGTGLGLAISRRIVTDFGGEIEIDSTLNQGTRVIFRLAACREAAEPISSSAATASPSASAARGRILVVDDEEMVRSVVNAMLKREHEVLTADSGRAARELIVKDQRFDVILCDLMMSDVSGIELHAWLAECYPELAHRLTFITGGVFTPQTEQDLSRLSNMVIQKPFDAATLQKTVRDHLAAVRDPTR